MKEKHILELVKDVEGKCCIHLDTLGFFVSDELKELILKELKSHLGENKEFNSKICEAVETIDMCNNWD